MSSNFLFHIRPRKIPAEALCFSLTYGLGGAAVLMVVVQFVTGLLLNLLYIPFPVQAYLSVQYIQEEVFLGQLIRNLHHWTGHFLLIVVCLHLLRVFFSGAYLPPRRRNWYVGLFLGSLVLAANFTGYLLPWDQLAFWAVSIATAMLGYIPFIGESLQGIIRGGVDVNGATLQIFHSFHTTLLPLAFLSGMAYHFWSIRKVGGVKLSAEKKQKMLPAIPELWVRELSFAAILSCFLLLFAMQFDAPLMAMADPLHTPENVKAPWYFLWLQELLLHLRPVLALCSLPLAFTAFLVLLPFTGYEKMNPSRMVKSTMIFFVLVILLLTVTGVWFRAAGMKLIFPW